MKQRSNLHPAGIKGYYIYKHPRRFEKWVAHRKWDKVNQKAAVFYSFEDALAWFDSLPAVYPVGVGALVEV